MEELRIQLLSRGGIYSSGTFRPSASELCGDDVFPVQDIDHGHLLGPTELVWIQVGLSNEQLYVCRNFRLAKNLIQFNG